LPTNKELVSKIVKQLVMLKNSGMLKNELTNKYNEGNKGGMHYYSQSSSHPHLPQNNP
jgi:hypothetical protein